MSTNNHRQDRYELNAEGKPIQTGSRAFITRLAARTFETQSHVLRMDGKHFNETFIKEKGIFLTCLRMLHLCSKFFHSIYVMFIISGFNQPVLFENSAGLDLRVPPSGTFTVRTVERHCGVDREVDVIDVTRQNNFKMPLGDFVDYFTESNKSKILNVLSLEFSDTSLVFFKIIIYIGTYVCFEYFLYINI